MLTTEKLGGRVVRWRWATFKAGCPTNLDNSMVRASLLAVGAGGASVDIFVFSIISLFISSTRWETARYKLQYCRKA